MKSSLVGHRVFRQYQPTVKAWVVALSHTETGCEGHPGWVLLVRTESGDLEEWIAAECAVWL